MLEQKLTQIIASNKLFMTGEKVVIGVSGGPDSMALLMLLSKSGLDLECIAAYIDHGLRPHETEYEKEIVRQIAMQHHMQFCCRVVNVRGFAKNNRLSLEESARILRYRALEEIRIEYGAAVIAVAHTADDQVEEFLLRMMRGCGRKGLAGMQYRHGRIVRPLLDLHKHELAGYLEHSNISFCIDSSNTDRRFVRNRVRLDLLPAIERQFNPSIRRTLLQMMDILQTEEEFFDQCTSQALEKVHVLSPEHYTIPLAAILQLHLAIRRRIIEHCCWEMGCRPTFRQIKQVLSLIERRDGGGEIHLGGGLRIVRNRDAVDFTFPRGVRGFRGSGGEKASIDEVIAAPGTYIIAAINGILTLQMEKVPTSLTHPQKLYLDAASISFPLYLRSVAAGQRFRPFGSGNSKKVNRFLNDRGIPSRIRHRYPALLMEEQVIALPGLAIDNAYRVTAATREVLSISWLPSQPR